MPTTTPEPSSPKVDTFESLIENHAKLDKYISTLNPSVGLTDCAHIIFTNTYNITVRQSHGIRALAAACIFAAYREKRTNITLVEAVNTTGASMSRALQALWHVECTLDNKPGLPLMGVKSEPSDGPYAVSINGKPKKNYTITWAGARDHPFLPGWNISYAKLWQVYDARLRSAELKKDAPQAGSSTFDNYGGVTPGAYPQPPGAFISDHRAFDKAAMGELPFNPWPQDLNLASPAYVSYDNHCYNNGIVSGLPPTRFMSPALSKPFAPAVNPPPSANSNGNGHPFLKEPQVFMPAWDPAAREAAAKAWDMMLGNHKTNNAITSANAGSSTDASKTGTSSSNGHLSDKTPAARTAALDPAVREATWKAWNRHTGRWDVHSKATSSANATSSASQAKPESTAKTTSAPVQGQGLMPTNEGMISLTRSPGGEHTELVNSSSQSTHKAPAPTGDPLDMASSPTVDDDEEVRLCKMDLHALGFQPESTITMFPSYKNPTVVDDDEKPKSVNSTLQNTPNRPLDLRSFPATFKTKTQEPVQSSLHNTPKHPASTGNRISFSSTPTTQLEQFQSDLQSPSIAPPPSPAISPKTTPSKTTTVSPTTTAPATTTTPSTPAPPPKTYAFLQALAQFRRARAIADQNPPTSSTQHMRDLHAKREAQRAVEAAYKALPLKERRDADAIVEAKRLGKGESAVKANRVNESEAESAKGVKESLDAAANAKAMDKAPASTSKPAVKGNDSSEKGDEKFDAFAEKITKAMAHMSKTPSKANEPSKPIAANSITAAKAPATETIPATTTQANESSKAAEESFHAVDKAPSMETVPASSEASDFVDGDDEMEGQVWETVDIAPDDIGDKEWDVIDSKEITGIENREKAQAKVVAKRGGWTGRVRRGLFG